MTIEVSRRQLMASAGGMVLASFALPSSLRKILDGAAPAARGARLTSAPISEIRARRRADAGEPVLRPLLRHHARRARLRRPERAEEPVFYQPDADNPDEYLLPVPHRHPQHQRAEPALQQPQLGSAARLVGQRGDGRVRDRAPGRRRRRRPVHDGLLQARRHPVPLGPGRRLHHLRRLPLLDAGPDLAEPAVPDDRPDRPGGRDRRPDLRQLRPVRGLLAGRPTRRCSPRPASPGRSTRRSTTTA